MSKLIAYPGNFSSFEEYDAYFSCIKKASIGDRIEIYVNEWYSNSSIKTEYTVSTVFIAGFKIEDRGYGKGKFAKQLLFATNDERLISFYDPAPYNIRECCGGKKFAYNKMYFGYATDVKIKRIFLTDNATDKISIKPSSSGKDSTIKF